MLGMTHIPCVFQCLVLSPAGGSVCHRRTQHKALMQWPYWKLFVSVGHVTSEHAQRSQLMMACCHCERARVLSTAGKPQGSVATDCLHRSVVLSSAACSLRLSQVQQQLPRLR